MMSANVNQQPPQQIAQQFHSLSNTSEQCIMAVRLLRSEVVKAHQKLSDSDSDHSEALRSAIEDSFDKIDEIYESLESHAKSLPNSTPMTIQLERLNRMLSEALVDPHINELYEELQDVSLWMDINSQLLQMYADFLRVLIGTRRRSVMIERAQPCTRISPSTSPQAIFDQTFANVLKDPNSKKIGLVARYLEKTISSAILELKFGNSVEKQYVCLLKMLVIVNNGVFESVQIIAPHEDWSYLDGPYKQVDVLRESRCVVYRKMTIQANLHLMQTIIPYMDYRNPHTLAYIFTLFSKFSGVFETKCRVCKKILKNFLPPLVIDMRYPKNALHESCR